MMADCAGVTSPPTPTLGSSRELLLVPVIIEQRLLFTHHRLLLSLKIIIVLKYPEVVIMIQEIWKIYENYFIIIKWAIIIPTVSNYLFNFYTN